MPNLSATINPFLIFYLNILNNLPESSIAKNPSCKYDGFLYFIQESLRYLSLDSTNIAFISK